MPAHKAFRFRIYPTPTQLARLTRWEVALRWLWNLANEQRRMGLSRCGSDKVFVHYAAQNRELTELRSLCPWLNDVPADLCQAVLRDLDNAWRRCFGGIARRPKFKSRGKDHRTALRCDAPKRFRLDTVGVRQFPKLGRILTVMHRPLEGAPKTCAIVREGEQWFVSVTCQIEKDSPAPPIAPTLAIVPGEARSFVTSAGQTIEAQPSTRTLAAIKRARRVEGRRKAGSRRGKKAKNRRIKLEYKVRRQIAHFMHVASRRLANSHGSIVIATPAPDQSWEEFARILKYKLEWTGGRLIELIDPSLGQSRASSENQGAAIRILSAWESLVPARRRQPATHGGAGRSVKVTQFAHKDPAS